MHACISYRRLTPVVVSSDTPSMAFDISVHLLGDLGRPSLMMDSTIWYSGLSVDVGSGSVPSLAYAASAFTPSAHKVRKSM